jgi:hypothetical protein|tara:strand:+ start:232 stop:408 length:177 start_codon:yes stop_codon:yes gene_type:complete
MISRTQINEPFWVWVFESPNELLMLVGVFGPLVWIYFAPKKLIPIILTGIWYWYWNNL